MSIAKTIKDNTDDGRNIVRFLIDVMDNGIDGATLSHRLAAARLLTVYGHDDAPDFIDDNTPDKDESKNGRKIWLEIDEGLRNLIKVRTDDGRVICMFLIDVMEGKYGGAHVGHRVSAARELLSRASGKSPNRSLPRKSRPATPRRASRKNQMAPEKARFQAAVDETLATQTAVVEEPEPQAEPEALDPTKIYREPNWDPLDIDEKRLQYYEACYDDNFDPYEAAQNPVYAQSYTGCPDPECEIHGNPPPLDFDPNDYHY